METWDQRILAFISGLKTRTADGDLGSADISVYQRSKNPDR